MNALKVVICIGFCLLILCTSCSKKLSKDIVSSENMNGSYTFQDEYLGLSKEKLIQKVNETIIATKNPLTSEKVMGVCGVLYERAHELDDSDLKNVLENDKINTITKVTMIQLADRMNNGEGITDQSVFEKYIPDNSLDQDIRINLISVLDMKSIENQTILENIVKSESGAIVVRALRSIQESNPKKSLLIANEIINNADKYSEKAVQISIIIKSNYYEDLKLAKSKKNVELEKKAYIDFCLTQLDISQNDTFRDAIIFSLIDMLDFNAVKAVINHPKVDEVLKNTCISRNCLTFEEIISTELPKEDMDFIVSAMEMTPIRELIEPLIQWREVNPTYDNHKLDAVIEVMKIRGVPADKRRYENPPVQEWLD